MAENIFRIDVGTPEIDRTAYIAPTAVVVGKVKMGAESSLWHCAAIRGDTSQITIGDHSNIQDCSTCHADPDYPLTVGSRVSVGHNVVLHGCTVEDDVLVGMSSTIMNGAVIGTGSIVGAGALVTQGTKIPPNSLVIGSPAKAVRETTEDERKAIERNWQVYAARLEMHAAAVRVDRDGNPV
ncbi:gamma carbonic anhydrase family protein [Cumulibacter manganitolerans]|uniref:gamma carbonic anhydrase family protein n=1 Tax=Cumulibacter manganitolerans TaxID=1884992 RepID=UPI001295DDEB|nr:gamma carbonic anhydrase family protein [Cumulibacter manganitolerans]